MDFNAIIYAAIGGGGGVALGGLIATLFGQKIKPGEKPPILGTIIVMTFFALGINLVPALYKNMALPRIIPFDMIKMLHSEPDVLDIMLAMQKHEPKHYQSFITAIDRSVRNGEPVEEGSIIGAEMGEKLAIDKLKYADADTLRLGMKITQETYTNFKVNAPEQCANILNSREWDASKAMSNNAFAESEKRYFIQLIETDRNNNTAFSIKVAKQVLSKLTSEANTFVTDSDDIDPHANASLEIHRRVCDIGYFTTGQILELDDEQLVHFIRWSLQDESN